MKLKVFVCNDGSTDGTAEMLSSTFPEVHVENGTGNLYWGGGMRKAWQAAITETAFDYYLWLNDDTFFLENAISKLLNYSSQLDENAVISAACKKPQTNEFSYGGLDDFGPIVPNGSLQKVKYINGNLVLIPKVVFEAVGFNSKNYTHYLGDYDYGLRAKKAGFDCYTSSEYLAECDVNSIPYWGDPKISFSERWKMAHDVKGLAMKEYISFKTYHHGALIGAKTWIDSYLKVLFPEGFTKMRNFLKQGSRVKS